MNVAGCELGPYRPVSELQILAAVARAQRHSDRVFPSRVAEHLGFEHSSATTRRLRPQLEALRADGSLATERYKHSAVWMLTARGRGRLGAARRRRALGQLPESPQHRTWRQARQTAAERLEAICGEVISALAEAEDVLGGSENPPGDSARHFEVGKRVEQGFSRLGIAIHCLREWPEPDDSRRDVDPDARQHGRRRFGALKESQG